MDSYFGDTTLGWRHEFVSCFTGQAGAASATDERPGRERSRNRGNVRPLGRRGRTEGEQEFLLRHAAASADRLAREKPDDAAPGHEPVPGAAAVAGQDRANAEGLRGGRTGTRRESPPPETKTLLPRETANARRQGPPR